MKQRVSSVRNGRILSWGLAGLLALGCFFLFGHTVGFDFVMLDDDVNIIFNPHLGTPSMERLGWMWQDDEYVRRYMPLGWLGLSVVYAGSGLDPAGYHAALIGWHALNTVLLFALILRLQGLVRSGEQGSPWPAIFAALGAAAWAVNPLGIETIVWASGLLYAQAAGFLLLSLLAYVAMARDGIRDRDRTIFSLLALLLYLCSLLSYPIAVGVMPAVIGFHFWWRWRVGLEWVEARAFFRERMGFLLVSAVVLAVTVASRYQAAAQWTEAAAVLSKSFAERVAQASYVLTYYFWKPWLPFELSPVYTTLATVDPWTSGFLLSMGAVLLVIAACCWRGWRARIGPALAAYGVMMIPFVGLTENFHIVYDRYAVLPGLFMAMAGALWLVRVRMVWLRGLAAGALAAVIAGWAWLSYDQTWAWKNTLTLHEHISGNLSEYEFPLFKYRRSAFLLCTFGRTQEAEALMERGRARFPDSEFIHQSARDFAAFRDYYHARSEAAGGGVMPLAIQHADAGLARLRKREWPEAEEHLRKAIALAPNYYAAAYNRALCLLELNRPGDALHSFHWAQAYAGPSLSETSRQIFLQRLAVKAAELGDAKLAELARRRVEA